MSRPVNRSVSRSVSHPFGDLLREYRTRSPGLTQTRLAHLAGYDSAILVRMCQGGKDLTGPSGRDRVLCIITVLHDEGVLKIAQEANELLAAAGMPPLYAGQPGEAALLRRLPANGHSALTSGNPLPRHSLPEPLTHLLGREHDLADVGRLLAENRLVTLTGVGGVGKTRLALEVARAALSAFAHGACLVSLAPVDDPARVPAAIARALGVQERPGQSLLESLTGYLRAKQVLLLLDNYERVLDAAMVAAELLMAAPQVKVLSTSRAPLHLSGENEYEVLPLDLATATRLFAQRAQAIRPRFALDDGNRAAVEEIVERVDRLPLAIELAAAHIRHLAPQVLLEQLHPDSALHRSHPSLDGKVDGGKGLTVLTGGPRDLPTRQQTFWATLEWSYALLSEAEQRWLRRLGVFVGGAAPEQVAQLESAYPTGGPQVEGILQSLVEKNLVQAQRQPDGSTRYNLLELVREYALAKLGEAGELTSLQRRHAEVYGILAAAAESNLRGRQQKEWLERLEREHDNLRAALTRSLAPGGDALAGLCLANHLWLFWELSHLAEGRQWLEMLLNETVGRATAAQRGRALLGLGILLGRLFEQDQSQATLERAMNEFQRANDAAGVAWAQSELSIIWGLTAPVLTPDDVARKLSLAEHGLALSRQVNDEFVFMRAQSAYAQVQWWKRDCERARESFEAVLALAESWEDARGITSACYWLSTLALYQLDFARARVLAARSLLAARQSGSYADLAAALLQVGEIEQLARELSAAQTHLEESRAISLEYGLSYEAGFTLSLLGRVARDRGDYEKARVLFEEALDHFPQPVGGPYGIEGLACLASAQGQYKHAARLFGFVEAYRASTHDPWWGKDEFDLGPWLNRARDGLTPDAFAAAWAAGRAMTVDQAVAYALAR